MHGLSADKKRELEEMMKKFALSLGADEESKNAAPEVQPGKERLPFGRKPGVPSSATSRFADSAYASMSGSGQSGAGPGNDKGSKGKSNSNSNSNSISVSKSNSNSNFNSNNSGHGSGYNRQPSSRLTAGYNARNVQSYLQDIPEGLLPRENVPMTDKAQKRMIVRRLEQIFAGRGAADEGNQQPQQQQEVAQSAANADRRAKEESGRHVSAEGLREARIMSAVTLPQSIHRPPSAIKMDWAESDQKSMPVGSDADAAATAATVNAATTAAAEQMFGKESDSSSSSPDQRPTRPLDLDPFRAQVADDNLRYMRHLGFSPTDLDSGDAPEEGHGWIYLNLLMNMAQLHTVNVTPEIVRKAISNLSTKLELSRDGRKVRWKGGRGMTNSNSDQSTPSNGPRRSTTPSSDNAEPSASAVDGSKRQKTARNGNEFDPGTGTTDSSKQSSMQDRHPLWYSPVLCRPDRYYEDSGLSSDGSSGETFARNDLMAKVSRGLSGLKEKSHPATVRQNDGPIIFYNNVRFCTDLSGDGDKSLLSMQSEKATVKPAAYKPVLDRPIGVVECAVCSSDDGSENGAEAEMSDRQTKGPLSKAKATDIVDAMDLDMEEMDGDMPAQSASSSGFGANFVIQPSSFSRTGSTATDSSDMQVVPSEENLDTPQEFAVTGLGGVQPADNFAIDVECRRVRTVLDGDGAGKVVAHRRSKATAPRRRYHSRIQEALQRSDHGSEDFADGAATNSGVLGKSATAVVDFASSRRSPRHRRSQQIIKEDIINARCQELPTSMLPSPLFLPFSSSSNDAIDYMDEASTTGIDVASLAGQAARCDSSDSDISGEGEESEDVDVPSDVRMHGSSSSDDSDSDDDDVMSIREVRANGRVAAGNARKRARPAMVSRTASKKSSRAGSTSAGEASGEDTFSSSVDFLAEARELDPESVRERERDYAADVADRLAEEIPAGSSAATAGGGSGFNSPEDEANGGRGGRNDRGGSGGQSGGSGQSDGSGTGSGSGSSGYGSSGYGSSGYGSSGYGSSECGSSECGS